VAGTPTFFINGRRHQGAYDVETLTAAIRLARHRYKIDAAQRAPGNPEADGTDRPRHRHVGGLR
jgi:hypothetical protein